VAPAALTATVRTLTPYRAVGPREGLRQWRTHANTHKHASMELLGQENQLTEPADMLKAAGKPEPFDPRRALLEEWRRQRATAK
jgi:hypothetical protein